MYIDVNGESTFIATGGKPFAAELPTVVMLHGSSLDHRCWALQARWFAFHGYSVFAPDLPGHSLSQGEALTSIEAMGAWLVDALDAAGVEKVHLMGHSQGFLVALEAASILGQRAQSILALATAAAIPVNPALVETAHTDASKAADMMLQWGFGNGHQYGLSSVPGMQPIGIGQRIMASNPLATDLEACNNYHNGNERAASLTCPRHVVLAEQDRMTPLKQGLKLAQTMGVEAQIINGTGHMLPMESPRHSLQAMQAFIQSL